MKIPWLVFCGVAAVAAGVCRGADMYSFIKEIPVPGNGGWDYMSVEEAARRLYVSHGSNVVVIDIDQDKVAGEIPDTPGVHGVAVASELSRGVVTCGREGKAAIVDLSNLKTLTKLDTGEGPDGMLYDPSKQEAYTFNGRGQSATVIDVKNAKVIATIPLGGKPEFGAADPGLGKVFDNLEDKSEVVVIDTQTHKVGSRWPVAPGEEPSGLAIDAAHHRLFIGCGNQKMLMMDAASGKILAEVPIGKGVDATAFDPGTGLAFASCGDDCGPRRRGHIDRGANIEDRAASQNHGLGSKDASYLFGFGEVWRSAVGKWRAEKGADDSRDFQNSCLRFKQIS